VIGRRRAYPYRDGEVTVLGPEVFASADGKVICWKGENYVPQASTDDDVCMNCEHPKHAAGACELDQAVGGCRCTWD